MVPKPGETAGAWFDNTGVSAAQAAIASELGGPGPDAPFDAMWWFMHDVPDDVAQRSADHVVDADEALFGDPWPLDTWPFVHTRAAVCRDDRFFPAPFLSRVVRERLGIEPDVIPGGHVAMLSQPDASADWLLAAAAS